MVTQKDSQENEVKSKEVKTANEVKTTETSVWRKLPRWGWLVAAVLVFFALLGLVAACFALGRTLANRGGDDNRYAPGYGNVRNQRDFDDMPMEPRGDFGGRMMGNAGTSSTRVSGVVTGVDGDTLTVAGNGTTTKVTVSDTTTYRGDDKPAKVNDTIEVTGTKNSDGSFAATTVYLSRQ